MKNNGETIKNSGEFSGDRNEFVKEKSFDVDVISNNDKKDDIFVDEMDLNGDGIIDDVEEKEYVDAATDDNAKVNIFDGTMVKRKKEIDQAAAKKIENIVNENKNNPRELSFKISEMKNSFLLSAFARKIGDKNK